ncbi:MAG: molybdopterin-binding protein [Mangrovibacterium sp.]
MNIEKQQIKNIIMKLSARNKLSGTVKSIDNGLITAKVVIGLGNGNEIVSIISRDSVEGLGLKVGQDACAIIKSTEVIIGVPE